MGYKRAQWRSGLTYEHVCEQCKTVVRYTDVKLGFRAWFPDGFVYCPTCKKPLRHNENLAINNEPKVVTLNNPKATETAKPKATFCASCGNKFSENDRFCSACGSPRT